MKKKAKIRKLKKKIRKKTKKKEKLAKIMWITIVIHSELCMDKSYSF